MIKVSEGKRASSEFPNSTEKSAQANQITSTATSIISPTSPHTSSFLPPAPPPIGTNASPLVVPTPRRLPPNPPLCGALPRVGATPRCPPPPCRQPQVDYQIPRSSVPANPSSTFTTTTTSTATTSAVAVALNTPSTRVPAPIGSLTPTDASSESSMKSKHDQETTPTSPLRNRIDNPCCYLKTFLLTFTIASIVCGILAYLGKFGHISDDVGIGGPRGVLLICVAGPLLIDLGVWAAWQNSKNAEKELDQS